MLLCDLNNVLCWDLKASNPPTVNTAFLDFPGTIKTMKSVVENLRMNLRMNLSLNLKPLEGSPVEKSLSIYKVLETT